MKVTYINPHKNSYKVLINRMLYVLMALAMSPYMNRYFLSAIAVFAAVWLIAIFPLIFRHVNKRLLVAWLFLFYVLFLRMIGYSSVAIGNYSSDIITVVVMSAMIYVSVFCDINEIRRIGFVGIGIIAFNVIDNVYIYFKYPGIDNYTPYIEKLTSYYGRINVFGTQYALVLVFSLLALIITISMVQKKTKMILFMIMCIYIVFFGVARAAAIISLFIALCCFLGYRTIEKMDGGSKYLILCFAFIGFLLLLIFWQSFFKILADIMPNQRISIRLENLSALFTYKLSDDASGNSLLLRINMFILDIRYWLTDIKTFLIGNGYHRSDANNSVIQFTIINKSSGHTSIGDTLARYGLIGSIFIYTFVGHVLQVYKFAFAYFGKKAKFLKIVFVGIILVNSIANTIFESQVMTALLLIIPCYIYSMSVPKVRGTENVIYR